MDTGLGNQFDHERSIGAFTPIIVKKNVVSAESKDQEPAGKKFVDPWQDLGKINRFNCPGYTGPSIENQTRLR